MPVTHPFVNPQPDGADATVTRPSDWNAAHTVSIDNADVANAAAIVESKLSLNFATHAAVTVADTTSIDMSISGQQISAAAIFGTTSTTIAQGDHTHAQLHDAVTLDTNADTLLSLSTQALGLDTQLANKVFAGATSGGAAIPAFRSLVAADIPALSYVDGSGVAGQVTEWVDSNTIQAAKIIGPAVNILTLTNAAASTLALNITAAKTLTLTSADNYNLTIPATGTVALLGTANVFTANQDISNTAPALTLTDTTASAKSLKLLVDANVASFYELAGAAGDILSLDLTNKRVGIGIATPTSKLDITTLALQMTQTDTSGLALVNTTPAALGAGNQQMSPAVRWSGRAWSRLSNVSHDVSFRSYISPVTGSGLDGMGVLLFTASNNGAAYGTSLLSISNRGTGGVGIGFDDPDVGKKLQVAGSIGAKALTANDIYFDIQRNSNTNNAAFTLTPAGALSVSNQQWWVGLVPNQSYLAFSPYYTNPLTPTVVYLVTGEMGIGITAPLAQLHVVKTTTTANAVLEVARIEAQVSTASTGASNGFGAGLQWWAESASDTFRYVQGQIGTSWTDATAATRKAKLQLSAYDTAIRTGIEISANGTTPDITLLGDTWFVGAGFGLPYGSCYVADMATPFSQAAVQNTWYMISDAEVVDGPLNLMTHDGSGKLTASLAGTYYITWSAVCDVSVANKHLQAGISINGAAPGMFQHIDPPAATADTSVAGTRIITLTAGQTIELAIRTTDTGTPTITCDHLSISVVMVGG